MSVRLSTAYPNLDRKGLNILNSIVNIPISFQPEGKPLIFKTKNACIDTGIRQLEFM